MKVMRKIVEIDEERCDGCGVCIPSCAEGALQIIDGKARLVSEIYCDGLGACLGQCPNDAIRIVERTADEFDHEAVASHLNSSQQKHRGGELPMACGCPSSHVETFAPRTPSRQASVESSSRSALSHWPVQIRLVPPTAPFLKGADLLVAADCTPLAYANFHADFVRDKVVMVGCPKFDDRAFYVQKCADIFRAAGIKSLTVVVMEVPCCQGLPTIVEAAKDLAATPIPTERVVISTRGDVLDRKRVAA